MKDAERTDEDDDTPSFDLSWKFLPAVAGISVVESLNVAIHPIRAQLGETFFDFVSASASCDLS